MDKQYLKEHNLLGERNRFMQICEYTYVPSTLDEDDEEDNKNANPNEDQPQQQDDQTNDPSQANPQDRQGGDVPQTPDQTPNQPENTGMEDSSQQNQDMNGMASNMPNAEIPEDMDAQGEEDSDDEEVIDVDDLTNAQEKVNKKVNRVGKDVIEIGDEFGAMKSYIKKMENMISQNDDRIEDLKKEIMKRNPTPTEKLNMRSLDSYPYSIKPTQYWDEKSRNSNYDPYSDDEKEYSLSGEDINGMTDSDFEKSFRYDDDDSFIKTNY